MMHAGYYDDSDDFYTRTEQTTVYCCGYSFPWENEKSETTRADGKQDYQMLYVKNGALYCKKDKNKMYCRIESGNIYIYYPNEPQYYYYLKSEQAEIYWIHFNPEKGQLLLEEYGFLDKDTYYVGNDKKYEEILECIIGELQGKKAGFERICDSYFRVLLGYLMRGNRQEEIDDKMINNRIKQAVQRIEHHYMEEFFIKEEAQALGFSLSQFDRLFKQMTGKSPVLYIMELRVNRAKKLLGDGSYSVAQISNAVGYKDPYYFSRVFKKVTGISPAEYRKMIKK